MWSHVIVSLCVYHLGICLVDYTNPNHLVGYDCSHSNLNYSVIDMSGVSECPHTVIETNSQSSLIQLVEISNVVETAVHQCAIVVNRKISYCGMHSHVALVRNSMMEYPLHIGRQRCIKALETGDLTLFSEGYHPLQLNNLESGRSYHYSHLIAGSVYADSDCDGVSYADSFGSWEDVVVEASIQVSLSKSVGTINTEKDTITFSNGVTCPNRKGDCTDDMSGEYFWSPLPNDSCKSSNHKVLYEGPANFTTRTRLFNNSNDDPTASNNDGIVVTVNDNTMLFSLKLQDKYEVCNIEAYKTEHPKLIIVKSTGLSFLFKKTGEHTASLDMFSYINSKFVTIERNIQTNMEDLYSLISRQKCLLDKTSLQIKLAMGLSSPADFGKLLSGQSGYVATPIGDVVYLTQCEPVFVKIRSSSSCFSELPVTYKNQSYFLSARTKLLQTYGTEITCSSIYLPIYSVMGKWYRLYPLAVEVPAPVRLSPATLPAWRYTSLNRLASVGIYTQENLDSLRSHIMFKIERPAVETVLTRQFQGLSPNHQGLDTINLFTEEGLEKMGNKIWDKIWTTLSIIGNVSSGLIGILLVVKCIKWFISSLLNGAVLYDTFGLSFKILGCLIDGLTNFFLHHANKRHNLRKNDSMTHDEAALQAVTSENGLQHQVNLDTEVNECLLTQKTPSAPIHQSIVEDHMMYNSHGQRIYPKL